MAGPTTTSKNQKQPKVKADSPEAIVQVALTAEAPRLLPLANGTRVWYSDPLTHKTLNIPVSDLAEVARASCEKGLTPRLVRELEEFHALYPDNEWDVTLAAFLVKLEGEDSECDHA